MPTLPTTGGDVNTWGTELNEYLGVALDSVGDVKSAALGTSGTPSSSTYLRGDRVWATPAGAAPTYINVKDPAYGAVGDATTDDTTALAAAFAAAATNAGTVFFPKGDYLTGTITWAGQSFIGTGFDTVRIRGKPSQDVFIGDQTVAGPAVTDGAYIAGLEILVDDSVDASGSFARGGVGNAAFAFPHPDGSVTDYKIRFSNMDVQRLFISSLSGVSAGQNASCGFYCQAPANLSRFHGLRFQRLKYGWYDDYPSSNLTSIEHFGDHCHWDSPYFNGCGTAWRMVNCADAVVSNLVIHGSGVNGFNGIGVTSLNRADNHQITFNNVFIEDMSGNAWKLSGSHHVVNGAAIYGTTTNGVNLEASYSTYIALNIGTETLNAPTLTVSGSRNTLINPTYSNNIATTPVITDTGTKNTILRLDNLQLGVDTLLLTSGNAAFASTGNLYLDGATGSAINLRTGGNPASLTVLADGSISFAAQVAAASYYEGVEIADPAAPAANKGRFYFRDNGSGKTQLAVRFPTGAVQVIATEP